MQSRALSPKPQTVPVRSAPTKALRSSKGPQATAYGYPEDACSLPSDLPGRGPLGAECRALTVQARAGPALRWGCAIFRTSCFTVFCQPRVEEVEPA